MKLLVLALAALAPGIFAPDVARGGAVCPTNSLELGYFYETTTDPVKSWGSHGYSLVAGTLHSFTGGGGEGGAFAQLRVSDRYRIVGPASAVPIPFRVQLHTTGMANGGMVNLPHIGLICTSSRATLRVRSGAVVDEVTVRSQPLPVCASSPIDDTRTIDLAHLPNEEFEVAFDLSPSNGPQTTISVSASFGFVNLPPGYTVESCQGYAGPVVPVAPRTWGVLKHAYR